MNISINNLHEATSQQVFDQVAVHLLTQMEKSRDDAGVWCSYRGKGGLKCAAGCLITDQEMIDYNIDPTTEWLMIQKPNGDYIQEHRYLIHSLQLVHDLSEPQEWGRKLLETAVNFQLDSGILRKFPEVRL